MALEISTTEGGTVMVSHGDPHELPLWLSRDEAVQLWLGLPTLLGFCSQCGGDDLIQMDDMQQCRDCGDTR